MTAEREREPFPGMRPLIGYPIQSGQDFSHIQTRNKIGLLMFIYIFMENENVSLPLLQTENYFSYKCSFLIK